MKYFILFVVLIGCAPSRPATESLKSDNSETKADEDEVYCMSPSGRTEALRMAKKDEGYSAKLTVSGKLQKTETYFYKVFLIDSQNQGGPLAKRNRIYQSDRDPAASNFLFKAEINEVVGSNGLNEGKLVFTVPADATLYRPGAVFEETLTCKL